MCVYLRSAAPLTDAAFTQCRTQSILSSAYLTRHEIGEFHPMPSARLRTTAFLAFALCALFGRAAARPVSQVPMVHKVEHPLHPFGDAGPIDVAFPAGSPPRVLSGGMASALWGHGGMPGALY